MSVTTSRVTFHLTTIRVNHSPMGADKKTTEARVRTYGGLPTEERRRARYEALIAAGLEMIGTVGYEATTVRAICTEASLTERYFYESFENREALLAAVYESLIEEVNGLTLAAAERALAVAEKTGERDPVALAREAFNAFFVFNEDPRVARILMREVLGVSPRIDALYRGAMDRFAALLVAFAGWDDPDARLVADGLIGAVVFIVTRWHLDGYVLPRERVVGSVLRLVEAVELQRVLRSGVAPGGDKRALRSGVAPGGDKRALRSGVAPGGDKCVASATSTQSSPAPKPRSGAGRRRR
jgi:AcrR family transcriptional regulator